MNVIALTAFIGLGLVAFFVAFFIQQTNTNSGSEQDALLPLDEETPCAKGAVVKTKIAKTNPI